MLRQGKPNNSRQEFACRPSGTVKGVNKGNLLAIGEQDGFYHIIILPPDPECHTVMLLTGNARSSQWAQVFFLSGPTKKRMASVVKGVAEDDGLDYFAYRC